MTHFQFPHLLGHSRPGSLARYWAPGRKHLVEFWLFCCYLVVIHEDERNRVLELGSIYSNKALIVPISPILKVPNLIPRMTRADYLEDKELWSRQECRAGRLKARARYNKRGLDLHRSGTQLDTWSGHSPPPPPMPELLIEAS